MNKPVNLSNQGLAKLIDLFGLGIIRGFVLRIYKSKMIELVNKERASNMLSDIKKAYLKPSDYGMHGYYNPTLIIRFRPGSLWRAEMHTQRYRLKELINKRLQTEFVNEIKIE